MDGKLNEQENNCGNTIESKEGQTQTIVNNNARLNVLDTSFFIKLKPLDLTNSDGSVKNKYYTTDFVVKEIKDEKARNFYQLNKDFIEVKHCDRESMKHSNIINNFSY